MFDESIKELRAEISHDRFLRVVSGKQPLIDADWSWNDED